MWTIVKVFTKFITILLLFYILVFWPPGMYNLSSLTRDWTHKPCSRRRILNHWITREVSVCLANGFFLSWITAFLSRNQMLCGERLCLTSRFLLLTEKQRFLFKVKLLTLLSVLPSRRVCCYDNSFPPEEKDWIFCYSNIPAMHNDSYSLPSLILAQQRVCASEDGLW